MLGYCGNALFSFQRITWVNNHHLRNCAHHRQVFCGLVARAITGRQARQGRADLHVQIFFCDHLVDEVIGATGGKHRISGGEGYKALLGHTARSSHEQLFSHTHLQEALRVALRKDMHVSVFGKICCHAHDAWILLACLHQSMAERGRGSTLPFSGDGGDHGRGGEFRFCSASVGHCGLRVA
ncbi:hypothetical protein D3C73_1097530 [compost metagenome]